MAEFVQLSIQECGGSGRVPTGYGHRGEVLLELAAAERLVDLGRTAFVNRGVICDTSQGMYSSAVAFDPF